MKPVQIFFLSAAVTAIAIVFFFADEFEIFDSDAAKAILITCVACGIFALYLFAITNQKNIVNIGKLENTRFHLKNLIFGKKS